jgi:quercetin dioxygenase-like cupin family protein
VRPVAFTAGEVVRFADGDIHGFKNTETEPFVYLSVTAPAIDFRYAYRDAK